MSLSFLRETLRRTFLRHEGGCSLARWRWLLHRSFTSDARQRAEGCSATAATLSEVGLQDGDVLAAVVQLGKLAATNQAVVFCARPRGRGCDQG